MKTALLACLGASALRISGSVLSAETTPAFPGVEGAGAAATGGRGGDVVHVTNRQPSGPGSLADAVSAPNRIVVFDVSGIIDLARNGKGGRIKVDQPNITIAGQTAPGEGICLRGGVLEVSASNVIVRYLRSRRGYVIAGDSGDALGAKPASKGRQEVAQGRSQEAFEAIEDKKISRGRYVHAFTDLEHIVFDHCSASWSTDENLSVTHANHSTVSYCIAAEGLDYANPKQTPPNHSEGSLWGCGSPDGRSTMHHMLYAHNRLRNPRTTGGAEIPAVLELYDSVIYDWSEFPTHTGSERVLLDWIDNTYQPGPSTPAAIRATGFQFDGDRQARVFASGNVMAGSSAATADNRLAVAFARKLSDVSPSGRAAMFSRKPFEPLPAGLQSAGEAYAVVLADAGATLPARDAVDLRIVNEVKHGTGRVIAKESDLPASERWPDYHSLPAVAFAGPGGLPKLWARQFGLSNVKASAISPSGYAYIEHYFNNTDPRASRVIAGSGANILCVAATISRAHAIAGAAGELRVTRTGDVTRPLDVALEFGGNAIAGRDYATIPSRILIRAGQRSALISVAPLPSAADGKGVVVGVTRGAGDYFVGCPEQSLVVIRR